MHRSQIVNHLIQSKGYKRYLEIGTALDESFPYIMAPSRVGVDPDRRTSATFHMLSDEFFEKVAPHCAPFDIVFIDGSHEKDQVLRDVKNSMRFLNPFGSIVMHDCNPQTPSDSSYMYLGTVWEAVAELRLKFWENNFDWNLKVVDTDCGCGIIKRGQPDFMDNVPREPIFEEFNANREKWLGLIDVNTFIQKY